MKCEYRLRHAILAVVALITAFSASGAERIGLRCRWNDVSGGKPLDVVFAGNPLLVVPPGDGLEVAGASGEGKIAILRDGKPIREEATLSFAAPDKPGSYYIPLRLTVADRTEEAELCVVIPHKASGSRTDGGVTLRADGQEIGSYRHPSRSGNVKVRENPDSYQPPAWWFRITEFNSGFEIAPGLTAGELVATSEDTGTKHTDLVPVNHAMWQTVITLRRALETKGIPGDSLKLISMFRAPSYNRGVGSNAFGRHIYGDAFDFYIDLDGSGKAADLNRDGKLNRLDAYPVIALIEDLQADKTIPMGGVGVYNTVAGDHVVTMHLDLRGHRATWGYLYSAGGRRSEFAWASRRFADMDREGERRAAEIAAKQGRKYAPPRREPLP